MDKLAIVLTVVIVCQTVLSLYQVAYYHRFMNRLVKEYSGFGNYQLVSEVSKKALQSLVLVLILDEKKKIVKAYSLKGLTIFSTFQPYRSIEGQKLDQDLPKKLMDDKSKLRIQAVEQLLFKYQ